MIRIKNELLLINIWALLAIVVASLLDTWVLRLIVGLPLVLFFPGYALAATLFPGRDDIGGTERVALSVALSVIISPVIGFILNFLWRIDLYPILVGLTVLTVAASIAAWYRRHALPGDQQMAVVLNLGPGGGRFSLLERLTSMMLIALFIGTAITLAYTVAKPREGERFTEFYIEGAESLPMEIDHGNGVNLSLGIVNHELETVAYTIEIRDREKVIKTGPQIVLTDGSDWKSEMSFVPTAVSAETQLVQPAGAASLQVASAASLAAGDTIRIDKEAATIKQVSGNTLMLSDNLQEAHAVGAAVLEVQRIEIRLLKKFDLPNAQSSLSLWIGEDSFSAGVSNLGQGQASYQIALDITTNYQEAGMVNSPVGDAAPGGTWTYTTTYQFSENHEFELTLYRNGQAAYRRHESSAYPGLYLWIHVN